MFTDQLVTPRRLEILVDVVIDYGLQGTLRKEQLLELLQPETLPDFNTKAESPRVAGELVLRAARDLHLVVEVDGGWTCSAMHGGHRVRPTREVILEALDLYVLNATDVEPYFALFYSYLLGVGKGPEAMRADQDFASAFNSALRLEDTSNPFNATKVRGLWRWFPYAGLGWLDSGDVFQCDPYERIRRSLPRVFGNDLRLDADVFAGRLAATYPELDGGRLYRQANAFSGTSVRAFSLGVAQALIGLHEDGLLILDCPPDSRGWDLSIAEPANDGAKLRSTRLDAVELPPKRSRKRNARESLA